MKTTEVILIPGLDDNTRKYGWFVGMLSNRYKVSTTVVPFGWQERDTPLADLQARLLDRVDSFAGKRLITVGVSAGGVAAAYALQQRPEVVDDAINVCGALRLPRTSHLNRWFSHKYEGHFDEMLRQMQPDGVTDERLVSIRPLYDGIVSRHAVEFGDSEIRDTLCPYTHAGAITNGLQFVVPRLLEQRLVA